MLARAGRRLGVVEHSLVGVVVGMARWSGALRRSEERVRVEVEAGRSHLVVGMGCGLEVVDKHRLAVDSAGLRGVEGSPAVVGSLAEEDSLVEEDSHVAVEEDSPGHHREMESVVEDIAERHTAAGYEEEENCIVDEGVGHHSHLRRRRSNRCSTSQMLKSQKLMLCDGR